MVQKASQFGNSFLMLQKIEFYKLLWSFFPLDEFHKVNINYVHIFLEYSSCPKVFWSIKESANQLQMHSLKHVCKDRTPPSYPMLESKWQDFRSTQKKQSLVIHSHQTWKLLWFYFIFTYVFSICSVWDLTQGLCTCYIHTLFWTISNPNFLGFITRQTHENLSGITLPYWCHCECDRATAGLLDLTSLLPTWFEWYWR